MKVVVTGASGFIGQELMKSLSISNHNIIALSRNQGNKRYTNNDYSVDNLTDILKDVDVVIHLAAKRGENSLAGYECFRENESLTENILKSMVNCKVPRIIYLSSISVYSDPQLLPWSEDQIVSPCNFYGLSKLTCEYLCNLYASEGIKSVIFRCAHVLGLEDRGYMVSKFLNLAAKKGTLCVNGKSIAKREFIYVKDVVRAIIWAMDNPEIEGVFNLGTDCAYTNLEVAQTINAVFQNEGNLKYQDDLSEGIKDSYMTSEKLRRHGFSTIYDLKTGIVDICREKFEGISSGEG